MASQQSAPAACPSVQVVENDFVQQFFHILRRSPSLVHQFYQESSKLGRPGAKREMITVSTLQDIDEKILSMNYSYLTGKDDVKRDFTQTFFLATQDKAYYVLIDIFPYVKDVDQHEKQQGFTQAGAQTVEHVLQNGLLSYKY